MLDAIEAQHLARRNAANAARPGTAPQAHYSGGRLASHQAPTHQHCQPQPNVQQCSGPPIAPYAQHAGWPGQQPKHRQVPTPNTRDWLQQPASKHLTARAQATHAGDESPKLGKLICCSTQHQATRSVASCISAAAVFWAENSQHRHTAQLRRSRPIKDLLQRTAHLHRSRPTMALPLQRCPQ